MRLRRQLRYRDGIDDQRKHGQDQRNPKRAKAAQVTALTGSTSAPTDPED
jgi:hypothetical protein